MGTGGYRKAGTSFLKRDTGRICYFIEASRNFILGVINKNTAKHFENVIQKVLFGFL
jgi:hypothetical protein